MQHIETPTDRPLKPQELAVRLRAALRELAEYSDNPNYYDDARGLSFSFDKTMQALERHYPEQQNKTGGLVGR